MKSIYTAAVDVRSGRDGNARSTDGRLEVPLALQRALGGSGEGTNPEQLLAAGWGACLATTLTVLAQRSGAPLTVSVHAEVDLLQGPEGFGLSARLRIKAPTATEARLLALIEEAKVACPYSRSLAATVPTTYEVVR
jgi:lipoyl-dependent peroxiredoxin